MPGDILDLIDSALDDWSASEDAMRWSPGLGRVICDGGRPLLPVRWDPWRHGTWSYRVTAIDARGEAVPGATMELGPADGAVRRMADGAISRESYLASEGIRFPGQMRRLEQDPGVSAAEVDDIRKLTAEAFGFASIDGVLHYHAPDAPRKRMRRCPMCNPRGNPGGLAIDGGEYARRRAARKRRARR